MKVLQISDGYRPATGGMERVVEALATDLVRRGHRATVATLSRPDAPPHEHVAGVDVYRFGGLTQHLSRFSADSQHTYHPTCPDPALIRDLQRLVDEIRPDIVHAHGWIVNSAVLLRLPVGTALVHTLHDYGLVCAKKTLMRGADARHACPGPRVRRCVACACDHYGTVKGAGLALGLREGRRRLSRISMFISISAAVESACVPEVRSDRRRIIPPFVDDDVFEEAARAGADELVPAEDFLLFVGALGEHKGLSLLLDAHRRMRNMLPLVLIGTRQPDTPDLEGTTQRPVTVRTGVPHRQIMAAMSAASAVVVPSRWQEPFGLVAVEAMAAGTPVVATAVGALPEIILDGTSGLIVPPDDTAALADALDRLVEDPDRRRRYGAAGRFRATRYTASVVVPEIINAYETARAHLADARSDPVHRSDR